MITKTKIWSFLDKLENFLERRYVQAFLVSLCIGSIVTFGTFIIGGFALGISSAIQGIDDSILKKEFISRLRIIWIVMSLVPFIVYVTWDKIPD